MVPKAKKGPTFPFIIIGDLPIPLYIPLDFGDPKIPVALDALLPVRPIVPVPKRTVNKNHQLIFDKTNIRFTRKLSGIAAVADPCVPQSQLEPFFRTGS